MDKKLWPIYKIKYLLAVQRNETIDMNDLQNSKGKKPDTIDDTYDSICLAFWEGQNFWVRNQISGYQELGEVGRESATK